MVNTPDTRTLSFDAPLDEGFIKRFVQDSEFDDTSSLSFRNESDLIPDEETFDSEWPASETQRPGHWKWISRQATRIPGMLLTSLAAASLNITRLSSDNNPTACFDVTPIVRMINQQQRMAITVSRDLKMPQSMVKNSAFLASSGVELTWLAILEESNG